MQFELVYLVIEFDFVFGLGAGASMVFSREGALAEDVLFPALDSAQDGRLGLFILSLLNLYDRVVGCIFAFEQAKVGGCLG